MKKRLFLDDFRNPKDVFYYWHKNVYLHADWDIVRNYDEFITYIDKYYEETNTLPELISFDHDLADEHYNPDTWDSIYEYKEKTGLECAKYLGNFCREYSLKLPEFMVHSQNPIGKKRIFDYLSDINLEL